MKERQFVVKIFRDLRLFFWPEGGERWKIWVFFRMGGWGGGVYGR